MFGKENIMEIILNGSGKKAGTEYEYVRLSAQVKIIGGKWKIHKKYDAIY